jgi:hypothetical protein
MLDDEDEDEDEDEDDNKPVWPTWAIGVLSGVRDAKTHKTNGSKLVRNICCWVLYH